MTSFTEEISGIVQGVPVTAHAFNKTKTQVAIVPNNNQVLIYSKSGNTWTHTQTLDEHDKLITSVDWAPNTNRLVTCSQDRNAYVWTFDSQINDWKPTLVLLRINRAATHVKWSPLENKFAVASGARLISICYFEEENDWWVSKHIKKPIRSTILSVDWHPENILLVAGCCDMKTRVFSAWIKGIDAKASNPVWGEKLPFGTLCAEFSGNGWVHGVAFSPSGNTIAWASHDSSITIANGPSQSQTVTTSCLPFVSLLFISETQLIAAGHDCAPYLFAIRNGQWTFCDKIDIGGKKSAISSNTAFNKFKQMDSRAQASNANDTELNTIHQNTITSIRAFDQSGNQVTKVSTSGVDGKIVLWDLLAVGLDRLGL